MSTFGRVFVYLSHTLSHIAENSLLGKVIAISFVTLLAIAAAVTFVTFLGILGTTPVHVAPIFLITSGLLFLIFIERVFL